LFIQLCLLIYDDATPNVNSVAQADFLSIKTDRDGFDGNISISELYYKIHEPLPSASNRVSSSLTFLSLFIFYYASFVSIASLWPVDGSFSILFYPRGSAATAIARPGTQSTWWAIHLAILPGTPFRSGEKR
jgi:hypothetical protein